MKEVHCINLPADPQFPHREQRRESAIRQASEQGFHLQFWRGIIDKVPFKGVANAHKQIIKWAIDSGMDEVTIMEDDTIFTAPDAFQYYLSKKPESFDLYFGGTYSAQIVESRILNGFSGLTFYTIHNRFYETALNIRQDWHFDRSMGELAHIKEYYVCEPFVVYQMAGYSENPRRKVEYDVYHKKFEYYKNRPPLTLPQ